MSDRTPRKEFQPRFAALALAGLMALAVVGLTQCRLMDDPVTGVDARDAVSFGSKKSKCVHQCEDVYKKCRREESERHSKAKRACDKLGKGKDGKDDKKSDERRECRRAEAKYHEEQVRLCKDAKKRCRENCRYKEGAGSAGR